MLDRLSRVESIDQRARCSAWLSLRRRGDTLLQPSRAHRTPDAATQPVKHSAPNLMPFRAARRMHAAIGLAAAFRTFPDDARSMQTPERGSARIQGIFFRVRPRPNAEIACAHCMPSGPIVQALRDAEIWAWMLRFAGSRYCARGIGGTPAFRDNHLTARRCK